jgi:hypothetical protein
VRADLFVFWRTLLRREGVVRRRCLRVLRAKSLDWICRLDRDKGYRHEREANKTRVGQIWRAHHRLGDPVWNYKYIRKIQRTYGRIGFINVGTFYQEMNCDLLFDGWTHIGWYAVYTRNSWKCETEKSHVNRRTDRVLKDLLQWTL